MIASGVSMVNEASEVLAPEVSKFTCCKVAKMHAFSNESIKMHFGWLFTTD